MEPNQAHQPPDNAAKSAVIPSQPDVPTSLPAAQPVPCPTCANGANTMHTSYTYAIGQIEARFPRVSAEKEFAQATGREVNAGKTNQQTFHAVLSKRENRYLARQLCWVLTIQGLETYLLAPRDPADTDLLVEAIRPAPTPN